MFSIRRILPRTCRSSYRYLPTYTTCATQKMTFDISSGNVEFGLLCPGSLMQSLRRDDLDNVRKIKSLQTSYSTAHVTWQCPVGCSDLNIVKDFIESIDSLERLLVLNYEADASSLWAAIFHHAKSLSNLAVHGPPQKQLEVWTPSMVNQVGNNLTELKTLEIDISLEEAERHLAGCTTKTESERKTQTALQELARISQLESIVINVNLQDAPSMFSAQHTWNVIGCISFPPPNKEPCKQLARQIFDSFLDISLDCALKHLELRFPRRCWDDRCQFWTLAYSVRVRKDETGVIVEADDNWKQYLPTEPDYVSGGVLRQLVNEAYSEQRRAWM